MLFEYLFIWKSLLFCVCLSSFSFALSWVIVYQTQDMDKLSPYECGFNPYGDARNQFEIRFYLVGILFIIFDLEVIYPFPWAVSLKYLNVYGIYTMYLFLIILTIGFIHELMKGALDLDN